MGDESKKDWAPSPGGKRTSKAIGLRAPLLLPPSPGSPLPGGGPGPRSNKGGPGMPKCGAERQEMGRAGPAPSSCCFLPKSLEGPESRAAALGRRAGGGCLDTWVLQGYRPKRSEGPWGPRAESQGWRREKGSREPSPTRGRWERGPAPSSGSARRPLPSPHCPQTKRSPPPRFLSPFLLLDSLFHSSSSPSSPPSCLRISLDPLSSSSSRLSTDARLLRTPSPGNPAACELTEGLQTW